MRKLFSYYGSKFRLAPHYGPPRRDLVIEPFAGSACYSTWWEAPKVALYDVNEDVCDVWDFLIGCSLRDIESIPDTFLTSDEWRGLDPGPRNLVFLNISYAEKLIAKNLPKWYLRKVNGLPLEKPHPAIYWGQRVKRDILNAKPKIAGWSIDRMSYADIPLRDAHWHVDPPYQGPPGRRYKYSDIDYGHLGEWCRSLPGAVDVCENLGADWLPFRYLRTITAMSGYKPSTEMVWRNDCVDLIDVMGADHET